MGLIDDIHKDLERGVVRLIVEYRERLRSEAVALCKDESLAEDLVFRTIERALGKIDTYKEDTNLFGWMRSIMTSIYRNDMKRLSAKNTLFVDADELERCAGVDWSSDEQLLKNSESEAIRNALSGLDPKYNQVLLMRYYGGFTLKQIARVLQLPLGTVCRRMQIAHNLLAGKLEVMLGRTRKPLAVLAAVLSFSLASIAAVVTVPSLAPVREAVADWFADGDNGGTGVPPVQVADNGGTGVPPVQEGDNGGTGVPPVQVAEPSLPARGTDAPSVQEETVSEPKQEQEETATTKQNTTTPQKEPTMNLKKIAATASAAVLGLSASADAYTDVEHITTSPIAQNWMVLDYTPVSNTIIEATIAIPADTLGDTHAIFCARKNETTSTYTGYIVSKKYRFDYGNTKQLIIAGPQVVADTKYVITYNPAVGILSQKEGEANPTKIGSTTMIDGFEAGNKLMLFATYTGAAPTEPVASGSYANFKVYGVRIWEGEQTEDRLLYDLRPCTDAQGVECLRDAKNGNVLHYLKGLALFTRKDTPGWWGDAANWSAMPNVASTAIKFNVNDGSPLYAYLKDGDNFSYPDVPMTVGCSTRNPSTAVTTATVTIPTNAALAVKSMTVGSAGVTGVVEVVGGTLAAREIVCGSYSGLVGVLKAKDGTVTGISYLGSGTDGKGIIEADHSYLKTAKSAQWPIGWSGADNYVSLKNGSTLEVAQSLWLGVNGATKILRGSLYAEDSLIVVTNGSVSFATGGRGALALTNSTLRVSGDFTSGARQFYATGSEGTPVVEQIGASTNQLGGSLSLWGNFRYLLDGKGKQAKLQCSSINFNPCDAGVTQRFELVSGEVVLPSSETLANGLYKDCPGVASFSMRGSSSRMTLSFIRRRTSVDPLLMEFVIDRTGAPCILYDFFNSSYNVPTAALTAKLHGGLQLLHTNTFVFADSHVDGKATANLRAAYNWQAKRTYADLNPAEHHLWTLGPQSDGNDHPIGVLAGTKTFGAELNAAEELEIGTRYADGLTCGWVRLPRFRPGRHICRILLDVEPQGGHTLAEIADGLTAAGYPTKCSTGKYNLRVTIPSEDIRTESSGEVVAFDFAEYGTFSAVHDLTPTDVRARVRQVDVVIDPGLAIILK